MAVCDTIRIGRSRLVEGENYRGRIASKRRFFFGFRVQLVTTSDKQPVQFFILPGSIVDITALQMMHLDLPAGSEVFGDAGYTDYEQEAFYADCRQIYLRIQRKSNSKRPDQAWQAAYKKVLLSALSRPSVKSRCGFPKRFMLSRKPVF